METTAEDLIDPLVGRLLDDRYRLDSLIARGGMATVFLGNDTRLDRTVAVKVMHRALADDPEFVARFTREARASARLSSAEVVAVYDQGTDARTGLAYLVMEHVRGRNLRDLLRERGALPPDQALELMEPVLVALAAAHAAGLVHRDIKPENVLVIDGQTAKLLDLGLAYNRLGSVGAPTVERHQSSGRKLTIVGTPDYSSPEQSRNPQTATAASDVWSLGAMLYFLLTGKTPFDGETVIDLILASAMDPLRYPDRVTSDCRALLELLMAKRVADRPQNGEEVLLALHQVARGERPTLPPRPVSESVREPGGDNQPDAHLQFAESASSGSGVDIPEVPARRRAVKRRRSRSG